MYFYSSYVGLAMFGEKKKQNHKTKPNIKIQGTTLTKNA